MDSSSPLSGNMLTCSRPSSMIDQRRLRPPHDLSLKCPRCDSTHTKFCYYNNYSLSQPRYFCKTCRRYWTKGGTLRNIPVGGGCRKNKKVSSKKPNDIHHLANSNIQNHQNQPQQDSHDTGFFCKNTSFQVFRCAIVQQKTHNLAMPTSYRQRKTTIDMQYFICYDCLLVDTGGKTKRLEKTNFKDRYATETIYAI